MNTDLQFDFIVDKEKNTLTVNREFLAGRQLVWDCYTKSELLDQWFAPTPLKATTKSMDFKEGGHWHFAMIEPNGTKHWNWTDYLIIRPIDYYTALDGFSNEKGEINPKLPRSKMKVAFTDKGKNALVQTIVYYNSLADLETVINMGMKDGLTSTLERLDALLLNLAK